MATSGEDLPEVEDCPRCDEPLKEGICTNPECPENPEYEPEEEEE
jgi:hypothetical protein